MARLWRLCVAMCEWWQTYHWATNGEYISKPTLREYIFDKPRYGWKAERPLLIERADKQTQWVLNGDSRGLYGEYPPASLT